MCGIAGRCNSDPRHEVDADLLPRMCRSMIHRGPDDEGIQLMRGSALGMRRLKVIDLEGGAQPMSNEDDSVWLVFNGEIYNFRQLRLELEESGHQFRSQSDSETIVHLYEEEGVAGLRRLEGMFAIAIWDIRQQTLILARDRLGKKPLYYALDSEGITFGSELAVVLQDRRVDTTLDEVAIDLYLNYMFIPHPRTVFRGVRQLPPASCARFCLGEFSTFRYWSPAQSADAFIGDENEAEQHLDGLLADAVQERMVADVPVGALLSGGLDSSLITAYMTRVAGDVRTFSIGFEEESFSELAYARSVASALGTRHDEFVVSYDVQNLIPKLLDHFGEPFADSSAIPMYFLSKMARKHVTVALSGDGADEVFAGYRRYSADLWAREYDALLPKSVRNLVESAAEWVPEPSVYYGRSVRKKVKRFLEFARARRQSPMSSWAFFFLNEERRSLFTREFREQIENGEYHAQYEGYRSELADSDNRLSVIDQLSYLPDDILVKVDRMSMASSLEVRSPFLDYRVVEFANSLPRSWLITRTGGRKRLLKCLAKHYLPKSLVRRPKQGFAAPVGSWLQKELKPWADEILSVESIRHRGILSPLRVQAMREEHASGRRDRSQQLWALLILELWLSRSGCRP